MEFTSWIFFEFLLCTLVVYYVPWLRRVQVETLVVASLVFYSLEQWTMLPLLAATLALTWGCVRLRAGWGRAATVTGIVLNLAALGFFKYKLLVVDQAALRAAASTWWDQLLLLPLPVGISFFVFHNISMLVDFSRPGAPAQRMSLRNAVLYIAFFPQLVSGPITRAKSFFPQILPKKLADIDLLTASKWIIAGYFMKLYCANNLNQFTMLMGGAPFHTLHSVDRMFLLVLYGFQIYADFYGYSAIAIGLGVLFGYRLPINFRLPYTSGSFAEFWGRWHISLSTWLKNYLYIPLGGNRCGEVRTYVNLLLVMLLGGLWHGAGLAYLVWGGIHGVMLALERPVLPWKARLLDRLPALGRHAINVGHGMVVYAVVTLAWLLFKIPNFGEATAYLGKIGEWTMTPGLKPDLYLLAALYSLPVVLQHGVGPQWQAWSWCRKLDPLLYATMVALAVVECGPPAPFIYFQF